MTCNSSLENLPDENWKNSFGIFMALISFLAILENGIVLITLSKYKVLHTNSNKLLASLAISDLLTGLTVAPLFAAQLLNPHIRNHCTMDLIRRYLSTFLVGASVLTLGFISYDRSKHLTKLQSYKMPKTKMYFILFLCWIIPFLVPLLRKVNDSEQVYSAVIATVGSMILIAIIFCYTIIVYALHKHNKQRLTVSTTASNIQRKAAITVIIIITCFVITILPIVIHHALTVTKSLGKDVLALTYIFGMFLCVFNSVVNPIIYYYRTPHLKEHTFKLLRIVFKPRDVAELNSRDALMNNGEVSV